MRRSCVRAPTILPDAIIPSASAICSRIGSSLPGAVSCGTGVTCDGTGADGCGCGAGTGAGAMGCGATGCGTTGWATTGCGATGCGTTGCGTGFGSIVCN